MLELKRRMARRMGGGGQSCLGQHGLVWEGMAALPNGLAIWRLAQTSPGRRGAALS